MVIGRIIARRINCDNNNNTNCPELIATATRSQIAVFFSQRSYNYSSVRVNRATHILDLGKRPDGCLWHISDDSRSISPPSKAIIEKREIGEPSKLKLEHEIRYFPKIG